MDRQIDRQMGRQKDRLRGTVDGLMDSQTERGRRTDGWVDQQIARLTDRDNGRLSGGQTDH